METCWCVEVGGTMDTGVSESGSARIVVLSGAALALGALLSIWTIRVLTPGDLYVSGLGATGMPLSSAFTASLAALGLGGMLLGAAGALTAARRQRARGPRGFMLSWAALVASGSCFVIAAFVPCSPGCPVPGSEFFTRADFVHLTSAITGFVLICLVMLYRSAVTRGRRRIAASIALGATAASSATGGLLALADISGGLFEFSAMTLAVCWAVADTFHEVRSSVLKIIPCAVCHRTRRVPPSSVLTCRECAVV